MPPQSFPLEKLNLGVNLRAFLGSVTMREGEAQDSLNCLPREDGGFHKTFGWRRVNDTALSGRPVARAGFSYRGKNNTVAGDTVRPGNYGLADDGADFTRRTDEFTGDVVLTTTTFYYWNHATLAFVSVALPAGVTVDISPKPSIVAYDESLYIVGFATQNLRYDPTDRALYRWGWESVPSAPSAALAAGGTLVASATYKYAYAWFDMYTGEETAMGAETSVTTTAASRTVNLTVANYTGTRHFNTAAVATDRDVGIVIYRTNEDDNAFYFLTTLNPGTTTYSDTGNATDTSLRPFQGTMQDEPPFSALEEWKSRFYALGRERNSNRLYHSDFTHAPYVERFRVRAYRDLNVPEGDALTAISKTDASPLVFTRHGCFRVTVIEGTSTPQLIPNRLPWDVGAVGPRAVSSVLGWSYFVSDRGPYRWREGLLEPQFIGENISPQFIDPLSGLCKLNEAAKELTEIGYEAFSRTVRFTYAVGDSLTPNTHMAYWIDADRIHGDFRLGWWPQSPNVQCMDPSASIGPLDNDGRPPSGNKEQERLVFADADGFVYEYQLAGRRGGLKDGALAKGFVGAGSTVANMVTLGGLFTQGDGLKGFRIELLHVSTGVVEIRTVLSNTATAVVPTRDFDTVPAAGDIWWVGGMPCFWRSWPDHMGDPHAEKTLLQLFFGFMATGSQDDSGSEFKEFLLDVLVGGGDFPRSFSRFRTAKLSKWRSGFLVNMTKRFFMYEFANSKPDETFLITNFQREVEMVQAKRAV